MFLMTIVSCLTGSLLSVLLGRVHSEFHPLSGSRYESHELNSRDHFGWLGCLCQRFLSVVCSWSLIVFHESHELNMGSPCFLWTWRLWTGHHSWLPGNIALHLLIRMCSCLDSEQLQPTCQAHQIAETLLASPPLGTALRTFSTGVIFGTEHKRVVRCFITVLLSQLHTSRQ